MNNESDLNPMCPSSDTGTLVFPSLHAAASASLQVASAPKIIRQDSPSRVTAALALIPKAGAVRLYEDVNGRRETYHALKYTSGTPATQPAARTFYLGRLTADQLQQIRAAVDDARAARRRLPVNPAINRQRIRMLRRCLREAHRLARRLARDCGFRFKGFRLMKERKRP